MPTRLDKSNNFKIYSLYIRSHNISYICYCIKCYVYFIKFITKVIYLNICIIRLENWVQLLKNNLKISLA